MHDKFYLTLFDFFTFASFLMSWGCTRRQLTPLPTLLSLFFARAPGWPGYLTTYWATFSSLKFGVWHHRGPRTWTHRWCDGWHFWFTTRKIGKNYFNLLKAIIWKAITVPVFLEIGLMRAWNKLKYITNQMLSLYHWNSFLHNYLP